MNVIIFSFTSNKFYFEYLCKVDFVFFKEKNAIKKLQNIVEDHKERLKKLNDAQDKDNFKAELITSNLDIVDNTIQFVRQALAKQMHWDEIWKVIKQLNYEDNGKTYANVKQLKLNVNHITVELLYVSFN